MDNNQTINVKARYNNIPYYGNTYHTGDEFLMNASDFAGRFHHIVSPLGMSHKLLAPEPESMREYNDHDEITPEMLDGHDLELKEGHPLEHTHKDESGMHFVHQHVGGDEPHDHDDNEENDGFLHYHLDENEQKYYHSHDNTGAHVH